MQESQKRVISPKGDGPRPGFQYGFAIPTKTGIQKNRQGKSFPIFGILSEYAMYK